MQKRLYILFVLLAVCSATWCIYRDIHIEKQYTGDLRNRVVGARLQQDGVAPYFYKWKSADGLRYYDPQNFDTLKVSNITATPFFHQMLYPLANQPQRAISKIWLGVEYILLILITLLAASFAKYRLQKLAVFFTALLFLYTSAWTNHIAAGQIYLFIPFFSILFYFCIHKKTSLAIPAGICAAILLLIRPTALVFLLPFLFLYKKYSTKYKLVLLASALSFGALFLFSGQSLSFWKNFSDAIKEQLKAHQSLGPTPQINEADPGYNNWEGWDMHAVAKEYAAFPYDYNQEHGNIFVLLNHALHIKIPVWTLAVSSISIMMLAVFIMYRKNPTILNAPYGIAILASCLYMITDTFSPIHRFLYNGVQWLFPLLLIATAYNKKYGWIYAALFVGLLLNSAAFSIIPMVNTLGEYLVFGSIFIYLFYYKPVV